MPNTPPERAVPSTLTDSAHLIDRARNGDRSALSALFRRQGHLLRRWAHGRLPAWARRITDTADVVQDALLQTFRRLDVFEDRGKGALQAYLRRAVDNRIHDEMRRVIRRPVEEWPEEGLVLVSHHESPFDAAWRAEQDEKYKRALAELDDEERLLVVGRLELDYTYEQLALAAGRPTPEAARMAVRRAVIKLANTMSRG